jgi:tetratricopeptide (TPR) repeat protein
MKRSLSIVAVLLCSFCIKAAPVDSIQAEINKAKEDTNKVNLLIEAFVLTRNSEPAKGEQYAKQGIALSEKLNFTNGMLNLYKDYGSFIEIQGKYDEAQAFFDKGMALAKKQNNKGKMGTFAQAMGVLQYDKGKFSEAHEYILLSLKYREEANDIKGIADSYVWMGIIFERGFKKNDEALKYFRNALNAYEKAGLEDRMGYAYTNIGNIYYNTNSFDSSIHYQFKSLEIKKKSNDPFQLGIAYNNIANVYTDTKEYGKALKYYDTSLSYREQAEDLNGIATVHVNVGLVYSHMKDYKTAEERILKGLDLSKKNEFGEITLTAYEALSQIAFAGGDYKKAYDYHIEYTKRKDSVYNKDVATQMADMQTKYDTEKKDLEIAKKTLELNKKQVQVGILIGSIFVLLLLSYLFYNRYKLKKQQEMDAEVIKQRELRTRAIIEAEEKERIRIARELHDGVGQQISAVKMNLSAFSDRINTSSSWIWSMMR